MNRIPIYLLLLTVLSLPVGASDSLYEQKLVIVKGVNSFLMEGDSYKLEANKPFGYKKDRVLPALLSIGWRIKSIHINEKSTADELYGYVVIEKRQ